MRGNVSTSRSLAKDCRLSASDKLILDSIEYRDGAQKKKLMQYARQYLSLSLPMSLLSTNWDDIVSLGRDSSSERSFILRYGQEEGTRKFEEKTAATTMDASRYIKQYGEELAREKLKSRGASVENYVSRYGEELGRRKWDEYRKKRANTYKKKKESGHEYPKYNLSYFIRLHGVEKGTEIYTNKVKAQAYKVSRAWYIDTYGEVEGERRLRINKDHFSLDYYIGKYGTEEGPTKYEEAVEKRILNRPGYTTSKWAMQICESLVEIIHDLYYFGKNEKIIPVDKAITDLKQKIVSVDLFYNGKVIEFNGDKFHANPSMYADNDTPHPFVKELTAREIRDRDAKRTLFLESKGYQVLEIWESEWKTSKMATIQKCVDFLTK